MSRRSSVLLMLLISVIGYMTGASINLSVSPQRGKNHIEVGDMFYLYITLTDIDQAPNRPNLTGAKLAYFDRTSQQSSFQSVNGVTSKSYKATYTATLRAEKEGTFSYGPISIGGIKSNQVKYSIGPKSSQSNVYNAQNTNTSTDDDSKPKFIGKGDGNLFLKATVSESTAFELQALVYTVKLYTTYDAIKFIGATAAPKFDGFVVEESKDISNSLTFETYQGKNYATAIIARYIIFPQITGNLKITGNTYTISVDRREYYHDAFWGNMSYSTPLQLNVTPNDLIINVKALPEPKPVDFSGGVGTFSISSELNNSDFKTNQAASIIYKVHGTGNIKYVQLPDLSALYPPELEVYSPKTSQNISVGSTSVSGDVTFDYSFMPLDEGNFNIPEVKFVYFNPESARYETSIAKGYVISVGKGADNGNKLLKKLKFDSQLQNVSIKSLRKEYSTYNKSFLYWLGYIIPSILLLLIYLIYLRYAALHADMISFNSRRADKLARKRLKKAHTALKNGNSDKFYDELLVALWGYLSDKLKMPTSELMRENIRNMMMSKNVSDNLVEMFINLIDEAEFAKYSSVNGSDNMIKIYNEAINTINTIEKELKK